MSYTIRQASEKSGFSTHTLRYYEKEGILPSIRRDKNGNRFFNDEDIEWLSFVKCLKDTGMSVQNIKRYVQLFQEGEHTTTERKNMLIEHKQKIEAQIEDIKQFHEKITLKIEHYGKCCKLADKIRK